MSQSGYLPLRLFFTILIFFIASSDGLNCVYKSDLLSVDPGLTRESLLNEMRKTYTTFEKFVEMENRHDISSLYFLRKSIALYLDNKAFSYMCDGVCIKLEQTAGDNKLFTSWGCCVGCAIEESVGMMTCNNKDYCNAGDYNTAGLQVWKEDEESKYCVQLLMDISPEFQKRLMEGYGEKGRQSGGGEGVQNSKGQDKSKPSDGKDQATPSEGTPAESNPSGGQNAYAPSNYYASGGRILFDPIAILGLVIFFT